MRRSLHIAMLAVFSSTLFGQADGWPEYGGTTFGQRYSAAVQINPKNVVNLQPAWAFHTGAIHHPETQLDEQARFEATPVLWNRRLFFNTPFDTVFSVDAVTGRRIWDFEPNISHSAHIYIVAARGVALWHDSKGRGACANRVFEATLDRRLIALDAVSGKPCSDFGDAGTVDLSKDIYLPEPWLMEYTSPPAIVGNMVILGSSVGDNQTTNAASGEIRAFDARTGRKVWSWQPARWNSAVIGHNTGAGNAWSALASDPANDLVFIPTGSCAPDYFGGLRVGDNRDADSIVALRASTGQKVWSFQLVHHDLWDYDTASQPLLFTFRGKVPAVAVTNKTGMIYVFNRLTGEPLFPIEERPVLQTDVPGEVTWPTQPFSSLPSLQPLSFHMADMDPKAAAEPFCKETLGSLKYQGLFTPPSIGGSLIYPSALGGTNWGSSSLDPRTGVMYSRVGSAAYRLYLAPKRMDSWVDRLRRLLSRITHGLISPPAPFNPLNGVPAQEYRPPDMGIGIGDGSQMAGTPYQMFLQALIAPDGTPCAPSPYGRIVATDLNSGKQLWSVPHGVMVKGLPGSFGVGGSMVTAGGLIFVASSSDALFRAYRMTDGKMVWKAALPATANATPMGYEIHGRQYIALAIGGHWHGKDDESDTLEAFALPTHSRNTMITDWKPN